jgi:DNA-binding IscR family transcriptional regulator
VTLLEVVEAAEGPIQLDECVLRGGPCDWVEACPVHHAWTRAQQALIGELRATSFADLGRADEAIEAGRYQLPAEAPPHAKKRQRLGVRVKGEPTRQS